jgi:hypothetical protein
VRHTARRDHLEFPEALNRITSATRPFENNCVPA